MPTLPFIRLATVFAIVGCLDTVAAEAPRLEGEGTPVLFVGNSYLYLFDIPGLVQAFADSAGGERIATMTIAKPNHALIDHWLNGDVRAEISKGSFTYVVLQQGWTPAGVCRDTLRLATRNFADVMEQVNGRTALFEAWAPLSRPVHFPSTIGSYRLAAQDVNGLLLPIAEVWQEVLARDPSVALYADDLHPSALGSYLSAMVIYSRILNRTPIGLQSTIVTRHGMRIMVPAAVAKGLQEAAAEITMKPSPTEIPAVNPVITSRC